MGSKELGFKRPKDSRSHFRLTLLGNLLVKTNMGTEQNHQKLNQ